MNRLFEGFLGGGSLLRGLSGDGQDVFSPAVDVHETDDKIVVAAELPGVDPKALEIKVEGDSLWISGERKQENEEKTKSYHRVERWYGRFERQLTLPAGADPEKVDAAYKNGVLTIEVAKKEEAKAKTIQVKVKT
jgi:HSP20 family protein